MSEEPTSVEITGNEDTVVVVDSDNYRETQKLKAIQECKDHFRETNRNEIRIKNSLSIPKSSKGEEKHFRRCLTGAIVDYISELIPIVEEAKQNGTIIESDIEFTPSQINRTATLKDLARVNGMISVDESTTERLTPNDCRTLYRQCETIERKMGLGLDLEEDKGPAEI